MSSIQIVLATEREFVLRKRDKLYLQLLVQKKFVFFFYYSHLCCVVCRQYQRRVHFFLLSVVYFLLSFKFRIVSKYFLVLETKKLIEIDTIILLRGKRQSNQLKLLYFEFKCSKNREKKKNYAENSVPNKL